MSPGDWWEHHLEELAATEREMVDRHERRAQVLGTLCAAILGWSLTQLHEMEGLAWVAQFGSFLLLALATAVLALVNWPLERGRFSPGSLEERVWKALLGGRSVWASFLGVLESGDAELSTLVAEETRKDGLEPTQSLESKGAREALRRFLKESVYSDLGWWLESEEAHVGEMRLRLVFRWWGLRQAAYVKMMLVQVGMRTGLFGILLLALALGLGIFGLWTLLPLLFIAPLLARHTLDFS